MRAGDVALVTGASAGIGLAVCRALAGAGVRVAMVARRPDALRAAAAPLGDAAEVFPLDVGDLAALERLPREIAARMGRLDIVVNNAGLHHRGPVSSRSEADLAAMVNVNLTAPIVLSRAALELLPRGGAIVNIASLAGFVPVRDAATYSATKAGLRAFSRAFADEVRPRGIAVSTVSPGPVDTEFFEGQLHMVAPITFSQPMSTPEEVADAVLECIRTGRAEIALPYLSGKLATLGYLSPGFLRVVRPLFEKIGARKMAAYAERKRRAD